MTSDSSDRLASPTVPVRSTIGAGDSMLAGIVLRLQQGRSFREALRFGVAAGAATVMNPGTELCHRRDVERLDQQMAADKQAEEPPRLYVDALPGPEPESYRVTKH